MNATDTLSRDECIAWLVANDPNGCYTDRDSETEGLAPLTLAEARELVAAQRARA